MRCQRFQRLFKSMRYNVWGAAGMNPSQAEQPETGLRCDSNCLKKF